MYGHCNVVQQLLSAQDRLQTAQHHAADSMLPPAQLPLAGSRLQHSALDGRDTSGLSALHYAARWGYPQVCSAGLAPRWYLCAQQSVHI